MTEELRGEGAQEGRRDKKKGRERGREERIIEGIKGL